MANKELIYRTFDELMNEVRTDFHTYEMEGMIEPAQLIKVAQRVSYDLGLRIHGNKQRILDFDNGRVKLPDDFYSLTNAWLCSNFILHERVMSGDHTEDVLLVESDTPCTTCFHPAVTCICERTFTQCDKDYVTVVHKTAMYTREFKEFKRLYIRASKALDPICNRDVSRDNPYQAELKNGYMYFSTSENGIVYINYLGTLEDEDGNLLVLDHPLINEYYEYAIKHRILENLYMSGEDVLQKMQLMEARLRTARNNALTTVNTPNFKEMYELWQANRTAMYSRYYNMFKSNY